MNKIITALGFSTLLTTSLFAAEVEPREAHLALSENQEAASSGVIVVTECGHIINTIGEKDSGMSHEKYAEYLRELSEAYCENPPTEGTDDPR